MRSGTSHPRAAASIPYLHRRQPRGGCQPGRTRCAHGDGEFRHDQVQAGLRERAAVPGDINPGKCPPTGLWSPAATSSQIGCFSGGSYTLSNDLNDPNAVIWTVNGTQVAPGKYTVSNPGSDDRRRTERAAIRIRGRSADHWTVNFKKPTVCDLETLALTGQSPTGLLIAADLFVVAGLALFAVRAMRRRPEMA